MTTAPIYNRTNMKSAATAALTADEPKPAAAKYHTPNAEGIFEDAEQIFVPLPAGNICHFLIANTERGWVPGFKLFTRQPRNLTEHLPKRTDATYDERWGALEYCVVLALKFFAEHQGPRDIVEKWWAAQCGEAVRPAAEEDPADEISERDTSSVPLTSENWSLARLSAAKDAELEQLAESASDPDLAEAARSELTYRAQMRHVADGATEAEPVPAATIPPRPHYAEISLEEIEANPDNPRRSREQSDIDELANSIKANGLLQPIALRDMGEGREGKPDTKRYQIIFGEGRWLAHKQLGLPAIEAKVYAGVDSATVLAFALVENLQRRDMNAVDEAEGFAELARLGWTPARMSEQTGKTTRTIRRALALMKLPETVRGMVREGELSARQARELGRWVVPAGFEDGAKDEGFVARPRVCEIIADIAAKSNCNISSDDLAKGVPMEAIGGLTAEKLIVEIPEKYLGRQPAELVVFQAGGGTFTFDVDGWKDAKKKIDADDREAAAERAEKAKKRVETATESRVSVPLSALKASKAEHVVLTGDLEIYADHLPEAIVATGIDPVTKAEVLVCTQPEKLKALQTAEAAALTEDRDAKIAAAQENAHTKLKKLKKIGPREMALVIAAGSAHIDADTFKKQGLRAPAGWARHLDGTALAPLLAKFDPLDQARVVLEGLLETSGAEPEVLRWILEVPKLGLIEEDAREREKLIKRLASEIFAAPKNRFVWSPAGICQNPDTYVIKLSSQAVCEITLGQDDKGRWWFGYDLQYPRGEGESRNPWMDTGEPAERDWAAFMDGISFCKAWFTKKLGANFGKKFVDAIQDFAVSASGRLEQMRTEHVDRVPGKPVKKKPAKKPAKKKGRK